MSDWNWKEALYFSSDSENSTHHPNSDVPQPSMTSMEPQNIHENASSDAVLLHQHFQANQSQSVQESGPSQPETQPNGLLITSWNNHEVASSGVHVQHHFQEGCSPLVPESGLSEPESNRLLVETNVLNHEVASSGVPRTVGGALGFIEKLFKNKIYRRKKGFRQLRGLYNPIYERMIGKKYKNEKYKFHNIWAKQPDVKKFDEIVLELNDIKGKCQEFNQKHYNEELPNDLAKRLEKVSSELEPMMNRVTKENNEVSELSFRVCEDVISTEDLREKLHSLRPSLVNEGDDDEPLEEFIKKLNDACGRDLDPSKFEGLNKEEVETCLRLEIPESLKPIANSVVDACGKAATFLERPALILLCAAIKEMGQVQQPEQVSKPAMLKWGAAIKIADGYGFHSEYAEKRLKLIAYAHFFHLKGGEEQLKKNERKMLKLEDKRKGLEAEHKLLKECADAAREFR